MKRGRLSRAVREERSNSLRRDIALRDMMSLFPNAGGGCAGTGGKLGKEFPAVNRSCYGSRNSSYVVFKPSGAHHVSRSPSGSYEAQARLQTVNNMLWL